jgi:hypothetical protein
MTVRDRLRCDGSKHLVNTAVEFMIGRYGRILHGQIKVATGVLGPQQLAR